MSVLRVFYWQFPGEALGTNLCKAPLKVKACKCRDQGQRIVLVNIMPRDVPYSLSLLLPLSPSQREILEATNNT